MILVVIILDAMGLDAIKSGTQHLDKFISQLSHCAIPDDYNIYDQYCFVVYRSKYIRTTLDQAIIQLRPTQWRLLNLISIYTIRLYQKHLSRKLGNRCLQNPSCSHYGLLAFKKLPFLIATKVTLNRIRNCSGKKYKTKGSYGER